MLDDGVSSTEKDKLIGFGVGNKETACRKSRSIESYFNIETPDYIAKFIIVYSFLIIVELSFHSFYRQVYE